MNLPDPSNLDIEAQFRDFLRVNDIEPIDNVNIIIDGQIHRYRVRGDDPHETAGAYCIFTDGNIPAGWAEDWHVGYPINWCYKSNDTHFTEEQKTYFRSEAYQLKLQAEKKLREEQLREKQKHASLDARAKFDTCPNATEDFKYLQDKKVYPYGVRLFDNGQDLSLVVPLRDIDGRVQSLQWISEDGKKQFYPGAPTKGLFWAVGLDTVNTDDKKAVILIGEGFATMAKIYELTQKPAVAAMNCGNMKLVAETIKGKFPNARIIITADNDKATEIKRGFNPGLHAANEIVKSGLAVNFIFPKFDNPADGSDWDDFSLFFGDERTASVLNDDISQAVIPQRIKDIQGRMSLINAQDLRYKVFPPVKWAVDGFLPSGLSILAGGPKIGKSILALHLAVGVAIGGCVLGKINVKKGSVLYLALEDTERRLQDRINCSDILSPNDDLSKLTLITDAPRQHLGGLDYIDWWIEQHEDSRLVIIDTFQMFRKQLSGKGSMYAEDYDAVSRIKYSADRANIAVLILHHLKKGMEGDWLSEISGSQGISGAADTIFSLKRERNSNMGTLHRTGRDVEEKDFIMKLDGFGWQLMGEAEEFTMPEWKSQILTFLKDNLSITPMQLADVANIDAKTAQKNLYRLVKEGLIRKTGYGTYGLPEE